MGTRTSRTDMLLHGHRLRSDDTPRRSVDELKCVDSGTCELQVVSKSVITADDSSLEMLEQVTLSVEIGGLVGLHPILVAKSLTQECLLGADFLVAH